MSDKNFGTGLSEEDPIEELLRDLTVEIHNLSDKVKHETEVREKKLKLIEEGQAELKDTKRRQWWALFAVALLTVFVTVGAFLYNSRQGDNICRATQNNRDIIKQAIFIAYQGQSASFDFRTLPHYKDLDPATKGWVDDFQSLIDLASQGNSKVKDQNKNRVPDNVETVLNSSAC